jgi:hypothetical protein
MVVEYPTINPSMSLRFKAASASAASAAADIKLSVVDPSFRPNAVNPTPQMKAVDTM